MSLREEMVGAAEKGEQVEKNREQAEENREKIEGLENTLENMMEEIAEEVEGLRSDLSKKIVRAEEATKEVSGEVEKAIKAIDRMQSEGIELKEAEDLRRKIGRLVTLANLKKKEEELLSDKMQDLRESEIQIEGEIQDLKNNLKSEVEKIEKSAEKILTGAWWSPATGLVGGLVGVMMLALLSWGGYPILPQEARMTPSEISRVESSRYLDRAVEEMTEKEYDQYQTLLKKVGKRLGEPQD